MAIPASARPRPLRRTGSLAIRLRATRPRTMPTGPKPTPDVTSDAIASPSVCCIDAGCGAEVCAVQSTPDHQRCMPGAQGSGYQPGGVLAGGCGPVTDTYVAIPLRTSRPTPPAG